MSVAGKKMNMNILWEHSAPTECFDVTGELFKFEKWPSRQQQNNESLYSTKWPQVKTAVGQQSSRLRVTTSWSHVIPSCWRKTPFLTRPHIKARLQFAHVPLCEYEWVWGSLVFSLRRMEWNCLGTWTSFFLVKYQKDVFDPVNTATTDKHGGRRRKMKKDNVDILVGNMKGTAASLDLGRCWLFLLFSDLNFTTMMFQNIVTGTKSQ